MIILLLTASIAMAKEGSTGEPFQALWDAINVLEQKIENIQLIPGPKGEQGDKGDQGIQGEKGDRGLIGDSGLNGVSGWEMVIGSSSSWSTGVLSSVVSCPTGKKIIGGGAKSLGNHVSCHLSSSYPSSDTEWTAIISTPGTSSSSCAVQAYAICATIN